MSKSATPSPALLRKNAHTAYKAKEFGVAADLLAKVVASASPDDRSPETAVDRMALADAMMRLGRNRDAVEVLTGLLALDPDHVQAHSRLSDVWLRLGRTDEALFHRRRAAELKPGDPELQWELADAAKSAEREDEAQRALDATLAADPDHAEARAAKAGWAVAPPTSSAPTDAAFASLSHFVETRAAADAPPRHARVERNGLQSLIAVSLGAVAFLALYLFVRIILMGG